MKNKPSVCYGCGSELENLSLLVCAECINADTLDDLSNDFELKVDAKDNSQEDFILLDEFWTEEDE